MVKTYRQLAERGNWPLHLGVTEAGPAFQGTIKSAAAFGILPQRASATRSASRSSAPPVEEVKVGLQLLQSLGLREKKLEIVSCPSCGRAQVDVYTLAEDVTEGLKDVQFPLRVAVMGCVVNGPGEASRSRPRRGQRQRQGADLVKGEVIRTVPEADIVETLIAEARRIADEQGLESGEATSPHAVRARLTQPQS